ncbi:dihydrofolate reductase [Inquilinus sp. KBS0705]|nr:dihydrofolate reductase [Inquilinus sp. KBS0705]
MRKIKIIEHISLDGVIQSPGGREEDAHDFAYGGWTTAFGSPAAYEAVLEAHGSSFDLLLGRHTYDIWSGYWPHAAASPLSNGINGATKYIATHRPDSLSWGPVQHLGTDIVAGIRALKLTDGPDLILWGSSTLTPVLLENGLADEVVLFIYPVLLGQGKRFFPVDGNPCQLAFTGTKTTPTGVFINTYKFIGPLQS